MTMARPVIERVLPRLDMSDPEACWEWPGGKNGCGYGKVYVLAVNTSRQVHRVVYEALVGPIPQGLHLDHLCRNRACANPRHLEPVTCRENILRGTGASARHARKEACSREHAFTVDNTYVSRAGYRRCRRCRMDWNAERTRKAAAA